ncbi:coiled-coil domain-containing protein 157-like [Biomphalaria glabrata]|uniref:Coiled-coil domain-containing protein 157-like n=1 Tax=Biomphalaria glabrata TaxID=6526 RepID=A0A9U8DW40_BIOGL|nr:coiled-coil domain-containing protein 157-like [Biomphalaria glabrata]
MAYLLGNETCIESLQRDVQDLQYTVNEIVSRIGPIQTQSWKFPDKMACDLDIKDLLDLYSCDQQDDVEDRQVAHIALYELVIDRLVFILQALSTFLHQNTNSGASQNLDEHGSNLSSSVGLVAKQYWLSMLKLNTQVQQLQSESRSKNSKISELENRKHSLTVTDLSTSFAGKYDGNLPTNILKTPGTLGVIPPNNADLVLMGLASPPENKASISQDMNHKSCQTLETAFVACESCDIIQRKMREGGELIIKSCSDQGLPCSLKKFKSQVNHVELLTFNDVCHWMTEQNKDIGRIAKQTELLQSMVDPLKLEVKTAEVKIKDADEKMKLNEQKLVEVNENSKKMCRNLENKLKEQDKKHTELINEERKNKEQLMKEKEQVSKDLSEAKTQIDQQMVAMKKLEVEFKHLEHELESKIKEADRVGQLTEEMVELKTQLTDVTAQMVGYQKALAKEQGKSRSLSKHNESLQAKQEALLSRMDLLGQNNDAFASQVASLEEEKNVLEDKLAELSVETKELRKKLKENEVILKNLEKEKKLLEKSLKESLATADVLKSQLEEVKERERMILEYPDLNGPINRDYQGSGDIATDMNNQIRANQIRIQLLEDQNETLTESVKKISGLQKVEDNSYRQQNTTRSSPMKPQPLWQQDTRDHNINTNNASYNGNYQNTHRDSKGPSQYQKETSSKDAKKDTRFAWETPSSQMDTSEFLIGHGFTETRPSHLRQDSPAKDRSHPRPPSAKLGSVMAPVNATPISAYTHMKKSLGILQGKETLKKGRPMSANLKSQGPQALFHEEQSKQRSNLPFSCSRCDKMYSLLRDLEIHKTYCTQ